MGIPDYSHAEKEQILQEFRLLPQAVQTEFVGKITSAPDMANNANLLAAEMQGLINQHVAMQAPEAHPFAALLNGHNDVLASFASMQGDTQSYSRANTGRLGTQLVTQTQQRGNDDLGQLV